MLYSGEQGGKIRVFELFYINWTGVLIRECNVDLRTYRSMSHFVYQAVHPRHGIIVVVGPPAIPNATHELAVEHQETVERLQRRGWLSPNVPIARSFGPPIPLKRTPDGWLTVDLPDDVTHRMQKDFAAFAIWPRVPSLPAVAHQDYNGWLSQGYS